MAIDTKLKTQTSSTCNQHLKSKYYHNTDSKVAQVLDVIPNSTTLHMSIFLIPRVENDNNSIQTTTVKKVHAQVAANQK